MTNDPFLWFGAGFAAGFLPVAAFVAIYYVRARARVQSIKDQIERYRRAQAEVGRAIGQVYNSPKNHNKHCSQ